MESLKTSVSIVVNLLVRDMDLLPSWCSISVVEARKNEVMPILVGWWAGGLVGWWAGGLVGWWEEGVLPPTFRRSVGASSCWGRAWRGWVIIDLPGCSMPRLACVEKI